MNFCVVLSLIAFHISLASCRPQSVQVEKQRLLHLQRSLTSEFTKEQRGSMEETRRILQEIDRINLALGYKKRMSYAFPRVTNSETYFYPRQEFRPEFLTKPKQNVRSINNLRAINPFNAQNYYYPTPYLQVPVDGKPHAFKTNKYFYPLIYAPINFAPFANQNNDRDEKSSDGSIKLGTIVVLPKDKFFREPKAAEPSKLSKPVENVKKVKQQQQQQQQEEEETDAEIIEEIVKYELDPFGITGITDDDEDERQEEIKPTTERLPAIKNDKYLNILLKKGQNNDDDEDDEEQARKLKPPPISTNRAINLPNPIEKLQNFTKHFAFQKQEVKPKQTESTQNPSTPSELDIEDEENEQAENKEDEKSPFGFAFGPKQQSQTFKEGGLIIQRLRVRHGGIAIAGPGGVATAGSGGTAIVGPNGIAFTHPRGLAIGGPGARIYSVPESTDLEALALTHKARNLDEEGILVARGPVIYYNKEE